jgi:hypothetical protein
MNIRLGERGKILTTPPRKLRHPTFTCSLLLLSVTIVCYGPHYHQRGYVITLSIYNILVSDGFLGVWKVLVLLL